MSCTIIAEIGRAQVLSAGRIEVPGQLVGLYGVWTEVMSRYWSASPRIRPRMGGIDFKSTIRTLQR